MQLLQACKDKVEELENDHQEHMWIIYEKPKFEGGWVAINSYMSKYTMKYFLRIFLHEFNSDNLEKA